jgi:hypothetical protein
LLEGDYFSASWIAGNLRRDLYRTDMSYFMQNQFQATPKLVLNYGIRYEFFGDLTTTGALSEWRPGAAGADANGVVLVGKPGELPTYNPGKLHFSPRLGFNYNPIAKLSVRGSYGLYYDAAPFNGFGNNSSIATGSTATGLQANPVGGVQNVSLGVGQWETNQYVWANAQGLSSYGLFSVDPNLRTAYSNQINLAADYQLNSRSVLTLAYAGSTGVHLYLLRDANQPAPGTGTSAAALLPRRPCYINKCVANYQAIGPVEEVSSEAASDYNSLQATLKMRGYHGVTGQVAWTYGHSLDDGSGFRNTGPTNSNNLAVDWGNSTFDIRHTVNAYVVWEAPQIGHALPLLTKGWQVTAFAQYHTSTPFSITVGDNTGIGMAKDRAYWSGASYKTGSRTIVTVNSRKYVQYWAASPTGIFSIPAFGTQGNTARDQFRGPYFFDVDSSLVKNTLIHEKVTFQLRADIFNTFNHDNFGNPTTSVSSSTFGQSSSDPTGISSGAAFNVQFAGRLTF